MLKMRFLLVLLLPLSLAAHAASEVVTVKANGYGKTPRAATANALVEAARQGIGVSVTVDPDFRKEVGEWVITQNGNSTLAQGKWSSAPEPRLPTLASLQGYRVLKMDKAGKDLWRAHVEAKVLREKQTDKAAAGLSTLVVAPFQTDKATYSIGNKLPASEVQQKLRQYLVQSITQTGRLRVLDRNFDAAAQKEIRIATQSANPREQVKAGQKLGADLLLVGTIEDFSLGENDKKFYGIEFNTLEPHVRIQYRLIDTATREVLKADTFEYRKLPSQLREMFRKKQIDPQQEPERVAELLFPEVSTALAGQVVETLYPLRVLSVASAKRIYVSQGRGSLEEGDLLSAHRIVQRVKDPDTHIAVRLESPPLATLRITNVSDDYAVAELVTGSSKNLDDSVFLRVQARPEKDDANGKADKPTTPGSSEKPIQFN